MSGNKTVNNVRINRKYLFISVPGTAGTFDLATGIYKSIREGTICNNTFLKHILNAFFYHQEVSLVCANIYPDIFIGTLFVYWKMKGSYGI